jgi:outer membrane protein assembly factor BamB
MNLPTERLKRDTSMSWLRCVLTLAGVIGLVPGLAAQEWTRFRGPNGTGIGRNVTVPLQWTEKDFDWKVKIPGTGHSSPVLWGEKLFLTSGDNPSGKRFVLCLNARSGATVWTREFAGPSYKTHQRNSLATGTPTVDGERLYVSWPAPEGHLIMALDHDGKLVWQTDLGPTKSQHGLGVSLILHKNLLIVPDDQDDTGSLIALDRQKGEVRWKVPRK